MSTFTPAESDQFQIGTRSWVQGRRVYSRAVQKSRFRGVETRHPATWNATPLRLGRDATCHQCQSLLTRNLPRLLQVSAKLEAHRGQHFVLEIGFAARAETLVQSGCEPRDRDALINRSFNGPSTFTGIGHVSAEF